MDELIAELKTLTEHTLQHLDAVDAESLSRFVDKRGRIVDGIRERLQSEQPQPHQRESVQAILRLGEPIEARMKQLQQESAAQMKKISNGRKQKQAYQTSYYSDGVFFDRKN